MNTKPLRIVHITDTHILPKPGATLSGVDTLAALDDVLASMQRNGEPPHLIIATGDLSHDGSPSSYRRLQGLLGPLNIPVYCIPGNHDSIAEMQAHLAGGTVRIEPRVVLDAWQVLLLDSTVPGKDHGYLPDDQMVLLKESLAETPRRPTLIGLHHGPFSSCPMPACCLENSQEFLDLLKRHPHVRGVISGHNHHSIDEHQGDIRILVSPSTCIHADHPTGPVIPEPHRWRELHRFDPGKRGYRRLQLYPDGGIITDVIWSREKLA